MTHEEHQHQRLYTIALMAATLEAGDRARPTPDGDWRYEPRVDPYVERATKIFNAVDQSEARHAASWGAEP